MAERPERKRLAGDCGGAPGRCTRVGARPGGAGRRCWTSWFSFLRPLARVVMRVDNERPSLEN